MADSDVAYFTQSQTVVVSMGGIATAVIAWDVLDNLVPDIKMWWTRKSSFIMAVYFLSRMSSLGYAIMSYIIYGFPLGKCEAQTHVIDSFFVLAIPSTAFLFFVRARAVYMGELLPTAIFFVLWLALLGGSMTIPFATSATTIGDTEYCVLSGLASYAIASPVTAVIHDTFIFLAISCRLLFNSQADVSWKSWPAIVSGSSLPVFSKAILQDGQLYYLITVTSNLVILIMLYVPGVPVPYRAMLTPLNISIMNIMACRVYRKTRNAVFRRTVVSSRRMYGAASAPTGAQSISVGFFQAADPGVTGRTTEMNSVILETETYGDLELDKTRRFEEGSYA